LKKAERAPRKSKKKGKEEGNYPPTKDRKKNGPVKISRSGNSNDKGGWFDCRLRRRNYAGRRGNIGGPRKGVRGKAKTKNYRRLLSKVHRFHTGLNSISTKRKKTGR